MSDILGWISSSILVVTLFVQVRKQWHDNTSKGVSPWLFVGQLAASTGFLFYAVAIENWVFIVTNTLTSVAAVLGLWIVRRHSRRRNSVAQSLLKVEPNRRSHAGDETSREATP